MTTKVRVVFDGSAKSGNGVTLNEMLLVGFAMQQDLFSIGSHFRMHNVVITADIEKMYRHIKVKEDHSKLQRIFRRANINEAIKTYELTSVTYGTAPAPFLATRVLQHLMKNSISPSDLPLFYETFM
ncbi:hypothetical protein Trydic_g16706 [Trypoxylus dichotomus]